LQIYNSESNSEQKKYDSIKYMKFIEDKEQLCKLAPVAVAPIKHQVFVCNGKSCSAVGSADVKKAFEVELEKRNLRYGKESKGRNPNGSVVLTDCSSVGFCAIGSAVLIYPDGVWYAQVQADDVPEIIEKHLEKGEVVERLALVNIQTSDEK
jgi:(2Fe-2S) ferredoxin